MAAAWRRGGYQSAMAGGVLAFMALAALASMAASQLQWRSSA